MQVSVGGFYATGGTALRDLLKDIPDVAVFPNEFRLLKEHRGLLSLQRNLRVSKSPEVRDLVLREFLWLVSHLRKSGRLRYFQRPGLAYDRFTAGEISKATENFLRTLTLFRYPMDWYFYEFSKKNFEFWVDNARKHLFGNQVGKNAFAVSYDHELFVKAAQHYLEEIFSGARRYLQRQSTVPLILHNAVNPSSFAEIEMARALVPGLRIIIVDRDPRDNFLSLPYGRFLPRGAPMNRAVAYVELHRELRMDLPKIRTLPDVLIVKFEELVLSPALERSRVRQFLGLTSVSDGTPFGPNFVPKKSEPNVGLWQKVEDSETVKALCYIEQNLL